MRKTTLTKTATSTWSNGASPQPSKPSDYLFALVRRIGPYGTEYEIARVVEALISRSLLQDEAGNYYYIVPGDDRIVFASHLDTAMKGDPVEPRLYIIKERNARFLETDGKTILGADDRSGVALLCYMITKQVPGTYYFFVGEEQGCIGSSDAANKKLLADKEIIISFDRKGYDSVITHQMGLRTASDTFAWSLAKELNKSGLNYSPDPTGSFTDSEAFSEYVPECSNISVGYDAQHTTYERQNLDFLDKLGDALLSADFSKLIVERNPDDYGESYWDNDIPTLGGGLTATLGRLDRNPNDVWLLDDHRRAEIAGILLGALRHEPSEFIEILAEARVLTDLIEYFGYTYSGYENRSLEEYY